MKQAILITAYTNYNQLIDLVQSFDDRSNIFIHIDKKSVNAGHITEELKALPNVRHCEQKYKVHWGGINHLHAILDLSKIALEDDENGYFHLITGMDVPIHLGDRFNQFITNHAHQSTNYLENFTLPAKQWPHGGMDRIEFYNPYDHINAKTFLGKVSLFMISKIQRSIQLKRPCDFDFQLFGGSTYWTLHRNTLQYVVNYTEENPEFLNRLKFSFCAEEIYFQTIIMNSEYADQVVNDNLRYIDWHSGRGGYPAFLDESDLTAIQKSNKIFARKIDSSKNGLSSLLMTQEIGQKK